ncbi:MAG: chromate efflux transporter [Anaerolineae bacterium]|nr:chromate efflux transporter [Anaerolineae bacterium]
MSPLTETAALFLKLGILGFGGPAAHISMMEDEAVRQRKWLTRQDFLDFVGATNLIPGPNSTEMTMHIGYVHAGWKGMIVAGGSFILPAVLITLVFAWLYAEYGDLPQARPFLAGIQPVIIAVILGAVWRLGKKAAKNWQLVVIGIAVTLAVILGGNELLALFAGGILGMGWLVWQKRREQDASLPLFLLPGSHPLVAQLEQFLQVTAVMPGLWQIFFFFLMIGSVLYGSGYVLIAFIEGWLVNDFGWLTQQQLLDAVAVGQFTPGPVLTTATFIGYQLHGLAGGIVATLGIFIPSFIFVAILNPLVPRLRQNVWTATFLDAINVSSVGLMTAVLIRLASHTLISWQAWLIFGITAVLAIRFNVSSIWLVFGGALIGWLLLR